MVASKLKEPPFKLNREDRVKKLADEHWEWIAGLATVYGVHSDMEVREYLYKTAFIHGYKHAVNDIK